MANQDTRCELTAHKLEKAYRKHLVVHDFSITVQSGQITGLLGPNGAGKTTSFYMIVGLIRSDKGTIKIGDNNITHRSIASRSKAGLSYLPQEASVFRKLSVYENIMAILELQQHLRRRERKNRCDELLSEFNLSHVRNTLGLQLSGGERRRVEIARALATSPKFILLDEPFAGVDPISVEEIKSIIQKLAHDDIGVLITDHNVRETLSICDNATIMNKGNILATGSPQTLLVHPKVRQIYLGKNFTM